MHALGIMNDSSFAKLNSQLDEVGRMLSGLEKRLRGSEEPLS
jgi:hypothetical protein